MQFGAGEKRSQLFLPMLTISDASPFPTLLYNHIPSKRDERDCESTCRHFFIHSSHYNPHLVSTLGQSCLFRVYKIKHEIANINQRVCNLTNKTIK